MFFFFSGNFVRAACVFGNNIIISVVAFTHSEVHHHQEPERTWFGFHPGFINDHPKQVGTKVNLHTKWHKKTTTPAKQDLTNLIGRDSYNHPSGCFVSPLWNVCGKVPTNTLLHYLSSHVSATDVLPSVYQTCEPPLHAHKHPLPLYPLTVTDTAGANPQREPTDFLSLLLQARCTRQGRRLGSTSGPIGSALGHRQRPKQNKTKAKAKPNQTSAPEGLWRSGGLLAVYNDTAAPSIGRPLRWEHRGQLRGHCCPMTPC